MIPQINERFNLVIL